MTSTETDPNGLLAQMQLTIYEGSCAAPGAPLYSGSFAAAALGDPTQGPHTGDRVVNASASDTLCFDWSLPIGTGNAFKSLSASAVYDFLAEQTKNNP